MDLTLIGDYKRRVFHYKDCICVNSIPEKDRIYFNSKEEARSHGYEHCYRCSRLVSYYNKDKDEIDKFILHNYMKMYIEDDSMFIDNITSRWKITIESSGYGLILFHANTEKISKLKVKNKHIQYHYHRQNYKGAKDIMSMLKYILEHDKWKQDYRKSYKYFPISMIKKKRSEKRRSRYKKKKIRDIKNKIDK